MNSLRGLAGGLLMVLTVACGDPCTTPEEEEILARAAAEQGAVRTESGLVFRQLKSGDGPRPALDNRVQVHYEGRLVDGTVFDSSYKRGRPSTFKLTDVIPGWTEALQLMKAGSKWELFIPPDLAYGPRGAGGLIGPNSTLVFEIELLGIK